MPQSQADSVNQYLDRFYMSRIGIRFLFNQHMAVASANTKTGSTGSTGSIGKTTLARQQRFLCIAEETDIAEIARHAADEALLICRDVRRVRRDCTDFQ